MNNMPWFRVYSEMLKDRKLRLAANQAGMGTGTDFLSFLGAWVAILCLANDSPKRGHVQIIETEVMSKADIAFELGIDADTLSNILVALELYEMIHWDNGVLVVTNFVSRQYSSDNSTDRVRNHRAKQQINKPCNVTETPVVDCASNHETFQKRFSNGSDTDNRYIYRREFFDKFLTAYGHDKFDPGDEPMMETLLSLNDQYGTDKVLDAAKWIFKRGETNLYRAVNAMVTALPEWKGKPAEQKRKPVKPVYAETY